jgi:hypothetical protein
VTSWTRIRQRRLPVPELHCGYCGTPIAAKVCIDGSPHFVQPRACSPEHRARITAWDRWITQGRDVRRKGPRLPSMPSAEVVEPYRVHHEERKAA